MKGIIAGAGYFAGFQAEAWNGIDDTTIAAVADPDLNRAREFAARWGIERVYPSVEAAMEVERPDFVDIATRPDSHLSLTRIAADRGVAVVCQKPMAPTMPECIAMVEHCERAGVRLIIHENWRWQPWYREARRLVDAGAIGRPYHLGFCIRTGDGRGETPYSVQPYFRSMPRLLVFETLVHYLDTVRYLAGEFQELYCRLQRLNPMIAGEDYAVISAGLTTGIEALIDGNRISGAGAPETAFGSMRFEGSEGALRMEPDGRLFLTEYGRAEQAHAYKKSESGYKGDSVLAMQRHAINCLRSGLPAESEGRDYLKTVEAVEASYRSAETRQAVRWPLVFQFDETA
jgi:predicted dehydrogenase